MVDLTSVITIRVVVSSEFTTLCKVGYLGYKIMFDFQPVMTLTGRVRRLKSPVATTLIVVTEINQPTV